MTPGEALRVIRRLIHEGRYTVSEHVERDHPERRIPVGELLASIRAAGSCSRGSDAVRWEICGPADAQAAVRTRMRSILSVVEIQRGAVIVTYRRAR